MNELEKELLDNKIVNLQAVKDKKADIGLAFDGENHGFTVLLVELHHFTQHRVANDRRYDGLGGGDGNGAVVNVDVADDGGDDVAVSKGGPFAVFVFAFFGDDASWGDEARRHVSHSCRRHGPRWVARRSLI